MFRKPRDAVAQIAIETPIKPSTGRPPTPPLSTVQPNLQDNTSPMMSMMSSTTPPVGRTRALPKNNARTPSFAGKAKGKPNGSILNFFKKADSILPFNVSVTEEEDSLFLQDSPGKHETKVPVQTPTPPREYGHPESSPSMLIYTAADQESSRLNEDSMPVKRRRVDGPPSRSSSSPNIKVEAGPKTGPFLEDSDSGHEMVKHESRSIDSESEGQGDQASTTPKSELDVEEEPPAIDSKNSPPVPSLQRENISMVDSDDFEGIEDFDDEFPEEGEEFLERQWMEEQKELELGFEDEEIGQDPGGEKDTLENAKDDIQDPGAASCPICSGSFAGLTDQEASVHVNDCLDGKAVPLPSAKQTSEKGPSSLPIKAEKGAPAHGVPATKRFQRAAIAKPGQENPFALIPTTTNGSSAFSKLMSSHAEDAAWATAAATETASRGKPAYQRTCPFYKILPGFFICVDAFRYGAVEGCQAYFLSHFHSDHYIGLTSSWCHGPIYCSHVTANLVRRQLRVDPKWVIDLDFDQKIEVPRTKGVEVTMIPANHCPGSSLYLFEKTIGKGKTPKIQRVLHCGDFRACPAHVQHPLLRPDIVDAVTKKNVGQQKLDVCYLDTTYLTPKYAFPSQEEVIKACADMCVSLSKDRVDEHDSWEQTKKERAGSGMVHFVQNKFDLVKEEINEDDTDMLKAAQKEGKKARGRLLIIVGTYSIGKERICLGVAKALNSKIYAPSNKQKICAALEDPELTARLTSNPLEAQVHMQMLMEIRAETLADYLTGYKPHFSRIVGFRPSGWNYRPPNSRFVDSPAVQTVLHSDNWKSRYSMAELIPQRGSTREANCFGVPYSEHSSFRELTMFCCALRIDKIIPTVNVGSANSREKMKGWCEKWAMEKKKNGLFKVADGQTTW